MREPSDPVLLTEVPTEADAILLRDALAEHGVRAVFNGTMISGWQATAPAMIRVLVGWDHLERARRLVADKGLVPGNGLDWSHIDVGKPDVPECLESSESGFELAAMGWLRGAIPLFVILLFMLMIL